MANDRLRAALRASRLTLRQVAADLEVDPKTVERWITQDRTPYPRHRDRLVALLDGEESYFWPHVEPATAAGADDTEVVRAYAQRSDVPAEEWARLVRTASRRIDVLASTGLFLAEQLPQLPWLLQEKAVQGVWIRILLGDPDSTAVSGRARDRIRYMLALCRDLADNPSVQLQLHRTPLYASIFQFDDEMLVNTHLYGLPAAHAPVLHLRRDRAGDLFCSYYMSFERVWQDAVPASVGVGDRFPEESRPHR